MGFEAAPTLPLEQCRNRLAWIWFAGSGFSFVILVLESILRKTLQGSLQELWSWFVPTVVPSLALMLGVIGADALVQPGEGRQVKAPFFKMARILSIGYLSILAITIVLEPFSAAGSPLGLFVISNYWLTPIQGLVVAAIGVLFAAQEPAK